ncbi:MAG: alanine--tRNA ligase [Fimbriimonas sp.]|nr:alanine--tRNA ligase [Fimbriimonas sp.]
MSRPIVTVRELREKYLRFFESKGHLIHDSGSLIPYDVTGRLDESLLFNGAGMVQFKPYFRGVATPPRTRLTTAQKCVRTGDIDEVGDDSHLTFFEMLGNFSFGDYFKKEAIDYSWEFLTSPEWLGLDPKRLSFTVFEDDQEAYDYWSAHLTAAGLDPSIRIFKLGDETNYWPAGSFTKGPPGPCGPNSEMFYWQGAGDPPSAPYTTDDWLADDADKNWLEIWNDVFIQFEWQGENIGEKPFDSLDETDKELWKSGIAWRKTGMPNLPFNGIDTGMGIERTVAVLNGYKSVYDTDAFSAIFAKLDEISEFYAPTNDGAKLTPEVGTAARRIIADHIRTACFCIADGILPANNGRGYVLRRLIRRAVLKGQRTLGFNDLFMLNVAEAVFETFGSHYKELAERKDIIVETLKSEEELFRRTLKRGSELLEEAISVLSGESVLSGPTAFQLYDTFGFPLEVTQELCAEAGITVDLDGFNKAMQEAQDRSRGAQGDKSAYGDLEATEELKIDDASEMTEFLGYAVLTASATVTRIKPKFPNVALIALDRTPFYAESGGQTGDTGTLGGYNVINTAKSAGLFWHEVQGENLEVLLGKQVDAIVESPRRSKTQRHHTATHLLQASLRHHLGTSVNQAGSYNGPDNLRFDFTHGKALSQEEIQKVELTVNEEILKNTVVTTYADLPIAEAKAKGAMALFGEKYGDKVRMVEIGEFSKELCGGTHVRTTGEIGLFKIVSESSAASGVRRIEAVCGEASYALVNQQQSDLKEAAALLKTNPKEIVQAVEKTLEQLKEERKKREKAEMAAMSGESTKQETTNINGIDLWIKNFGDADQKVASQAIDNEANGKPAQVTLGAVVGEKITFMCKVGPDALATGAHAGNILREVAKIAGGGGGGQAAFATAGGRDPSKVEEALSAAAAILAAQLS